jgi:protein involved in polysaccharide export with SLBB domain
MTTTHARTAWLGLILLACAPPAAAQVLPAADSARAVQPFPADTAGRTRPQAPLAGAQPPVAPQPVQAAAPLLDAPVSRTGYLLGPGDVLSLSLFGDLNQLQALTVTPEGTVVIPSVGVVRVLGMNLDQAQDAVRAAVLRYYRNVSVNLSLTQVRSFKVFVLGDVPSPGVRVATAATRVSEVLPSVTGGVIRRSVLLRRASGDTLRVDLARFIQTGDVSANPTLREGDAVVVPTLDQQVQAYGRVFFPGTYEYRRGETLAGFLSVANGGGGFPSDAADTLRVSRFTGAGSREFLAMSQADALGARGREMVMQPGDAVYVPARANFHLQKTATVTGQVVHPGTYPIRPDTTTVRELVAMAGGFTPLASLAFATLQRAPGQTGGTDALRELRTVPPDLLSPSEREILRVRQESTPGNVVIDFQQLFAGGQGAYDQTLQAGDVLNVPQARNEVAVLGAVRFPGILQARPGQTLEQYVALAGGYARRADRGHTVVLKPRSDHPVDARDVATVDPGDTVIVPFRERHTLLQRFTAANTVIGALSGLALTIAALYRVF